ncbi:CARDB domain-containing protein [Candidatus Eisenbacteria bacterium]|uniref:CARDB domain-containing protein n=1 Tax=Eiseniibacteriota bacterium TaxID=2212470 RepID=A0ABV6YJS5_UNCEI
MKAGRFSGLLYAVALTFLYLTHPPAAAGDGTISDQPRRDRFAPPTSWRPHLDLRDGTGDISDSSASMSIDVVPGSRPQSNEPRLQRNCSVTIDSTRCGNDYEQYDGDVGSCGVCGAHLSEGGSAGWVQYFFHPGHDVAEGSLVVKVEFWDNGGIFSNGPDIAVWNFSTQEWTVWEDQGTPGDCEWHTYPLPNSNDYVDNYGYVIVEVWASAAHDNTCVCHAGIEYCLYPDLVIDDITLNPWGFCADDPVDILVDVTNDGPGAIDDLTVRLDLNIGGSYYDNMQWSGDWSVGQTRQAVFPNYVWGQCEGRTVEAEVDPYDAIDEENENNNTDQITNFQPWCPVVNSPGNVQASDAEYCDQVKITWNSVQYAEEYRVVRGSTTLGTVSASPFWDNDPPQAWTTYNYKVYAGNDECGEYSTPGANDGEAASIPSSVTGLQAEGLGCNEIRINWNESANAEYYKIRRDGNFLTETTSLFYDDEAASSGSHDYSVAACNYLCDCTSYSSEVEGTTQLPPSSPNPVNASDGTYPTYIHVTWSNVQGEDGYHIYRDGNHEVPFASVGANQTYYDDGAVGSLDCHEYCVTAHNECGQSSFSASVCDTGCTGGGGGSIEGFVLTPGEYGVGVESVLVIATPGNGYEDYTDEDGEYAIAGLPIAQDGTWYTVTPTLEGHVFNPENAEVRLTPQENTAEQNFRDESVWPISGTVSYAETGCDGSNPCYLGGVEILVDDVSQGVYTDSSGAFGVPLGYGSHSLRPVPTGGHTFEPEYWIGDVTGPLAGIDFEDQLTRKLYGKVVGGCDIYIGPAEVVIWSTSGCHCDSVWTDGNGFFELDLPPLAYGVDAYLEDHPEVDFEPLNIDLTLYADSLEFVHRTPVELEFSGFPTLQPDCDVPIMQQWEPYVITIHAFERYDDDQICDLEEGELTIYDQIGDIGDTTVVVLDGYTSYTIVPGEPNFLAGGDYPYQKRFEVAYVDGDVDSTRRAIVTGHSPREETFTTVSPEIPFLILRDPPADHSYSELTQSTSTCLNASFYYQEEESETIEASLQVGLDLGFASLGGEIESSLEVGSSVNSTTEFGLCVTATTSYQTWDGEDIVGPDGDIFAGAAINIIYAVTDVLSVNENCEVEIDQSIAYNGEGFSTTFLYTAAHIRDEVVPELEWLAERTDDPDSVQIYLDSRDLWNNVLALNDSLKSVSEFLVNKTFSGCTSYDTTSTVTLTESEMLEFYMWIDSEVAAAANAAIFGIGGEVGVRVKAGLRIGESLSSSITTTNTVGFHLEDDDCGDEFTVDIKRDPVYGTPIFDLIGGETSCPWEHPSQPREGVSLDIDPYVQTDVPPGETGVFTLYLGNTSQTEEDGYYHLCPVPESNPDGAVIEISGNPLDDCLEYFLEYGEMLEQTMTVGRGPVASEYCPLRLRLQSICDPGQISDVDSFCVYFLEPCTPVVMSNPSDNWVVNQASNDSLLITLTDYDREDENLISIDFQYTPLGEENWLTVYSIDKEDLPPTFVNFYWDVSMIADGQYEIRAATVCLTINGYSQEFAGVIDRVSPQVIATEPADGFLGRQDPISCTFSELIDCGTATATCCSLKTEVAGDPLPIDVLCVDNDQALLIPQIDLYWYENERLCGTVTCIADVYGNVLEEPEGWCFLVDRGPLHWNPASLQMSVNPGETDTLSSELSNNLGEAIEFQILGSDICTPEPASGVIPPGSYALIDFIIHDDLLVGTYIDTVNAYTLGWPDEPLVVTIDVGQGPPDWVVDPGGYTYSGSITAAVYDDSVRIGGPGDLLGAFVGEECRGVAEAQYFAGSYLFPLLVYSNAAGGEMMSFRHYDAYARVVHDIYETVEFYPDMVEGTPSNPFRMHITTLVYVCKPLPDEWNWFSLNVFHEDMSLNNVLASLDNHADLIKDQNRFSAYSPDWGWFGELDSIACTSTYKIYMNTADSLDFAGVRCDAATPIALTAGWNWPGYIPQVALPLGDALISIGDNGIYIKSQTAFAQYDSEFGWWGSLTEMAPFEGYMLQMAAPDTLIYADGLLARTEGWPSRPIVFSSPAQAEERWVVQPEAFEHNGSVTAAVTIGGTSIGASGDALVAFSNTECRGVAPALQAPTGEHLFCLIVYSNDPNDERLDLKFYDQGTNTIYDIEEGLDFQRDMTLGTPGTPWSTTPVGMTLGDRVGIPARTMLLPMTPNPTARAVSIAFSLSSAERVLVQIFNVRGEKVATLVDEALDPGNHGYMWPAKDDAGRQVGSGIYFCRLDAGAVSQSRKIVLLK